MKNTFSFKIAISVLVIIIAGNSYASSLKFVKYNPPAKTTNPNYDPNKGILGRPKDEKIIKRKQEPILKNRKNEPKRFQK